MFRIELLWIDGAKEEIQVDNWAIAQSCLMLTIGNRVRRIPLTSLREWRTDR